MDTPEELTITIEANGTVIATLVKDGEYHEEMFDDIGLDELEEFIDTLERETNIKATVIYETRPEHQMQKDKQLLLLQCTLLTIAIIAGILLYVGY